MFRWGVAAYVVMTLVACALSWLWLERSPLTYPEPWLTLSAGSAALYSLLLGTTFGAATVMASRVSVKRFEWAKRLHEAFRPFARQLTTPGIIGLALASGIGEEALFRGVLHPELGLFWQALVFGLVHQLPGPNRWVWVVWAGGVGLALGAIFQLTGSLLGPIVAHSMINGLNLNYLRSHSTAPAPAGLGGLLDRSGP